MLVSTIASTSGLNGLESYLKTIKPGSKVELTIGIDKDLSESQLASIAQSLSSNLVLTDTLQIGSTPEWPNALKLSFYNPVTPGQGIAFALPLVVLIIGALGVVGISSFLGFKIGNVVDSIAKYIIPITLISVGGLVLYGYVTRKK